MDKDLVDIDAYYKVVEKWAGATMGSYQLICRYEQAKLDKATNKESRKVEPLPELPLRWELPEKWSMNECIKNYVNILRKQDQLITCMEAVYKKLEES